MKLKVLLTQIKKKYVEYPDQFINMTLINADHSTLMETINTKFLIINRKASSSALRIDQFLNIKKTSCKLRDNWGGNFTEIR